MPATNDLAATIEQPPIVPTAPQLPARSRAARGRADAPLQDVASAEEATKEAAVARTLQARIGSRPYALWFGPTASRMHVRGAAVRLDTSSQYIADWIGRHFSAELEGAAREALGDAATVSMQVAPTAFGRDAVAAPREAGAPSTARQPGRNQLQQAPNDDRPLAFARRRDDSAARGSDPQRRAAALRRLDDFVVGPSNQLALDAGRRLAEGLVGAPNLFFVHGDCGVGKTHLLQGICDRRRTVAPRQQVRYTTAEQFTNEYLSALRENSLDAFRKALRRLDLLVIDDIHFLSNKAATQSEFLHTMNAIDLSGARIVLASDEHPRSIRKFSQQLVSRFLSGMVVRIERPDRETRLRLVRRLAAARGMSLAPAAEELIANRCVGSVREIEGGLARVAAFAQLAPKSKPDETTTDNTIGAILAEMALADEGGRICGPVRVNDIVEHVCRRLGVEREDVVGSGRHRRVVLARSISVHLARELTTQSFPEIARALGRDTHSTAHTAAKRVEEMVASNELVDCSDASARNGLGSRADGDANGTAHANERMPITELLAQLRHLILRGK